MKSGILSSACVSWRIREFRFARLPRYANEAPRELNRKMPWKLGRLILRILFGHLGSRGELPSFVAHKRLLRPVARQGLQNHGFRSKTHLAIISILPPGLLSASYPRRPLPVCSTVHIETLTSWLPCSPRCRLRCRAQGDSISPCESRSVRLRALRSTAGDMKRLRAARGRAS